MVPRAVRWARVVASAAVVVAATVVVVAPAADKVHFRMSSARIGSAVDVGVGVGFGADVDVDVDADPARDTVGQHCSHQAGRHLLAPLGE